MLTGIAGFYIGHTGTSNSNQPTQGSTNPNQQTTSSITGTPQTDATTGNTSLSLSQIYQQTEPSVVVIQDFQTEYDIFNQAYYEQVQGSGFIYNLNGNDVVITNDHVVNGGVNITVTFQDGNTYTGNVLGSDPYSDLAVLSTDAPQSELVPLTIISSSTLQVGDPVVAIGSPYGLSGSMTTGIVSALNRTITEDTTNGYEIADIIQTSTAINPGNSGGPLLNYDDQVIGITTAIVSDSQGLGFAIPSDTILREVKDLATTGSYNQHPYLGVGTVDMTYDIATAMKTSVTYGVLIQDVVSGGPAANAGIKAGTVQGTVDGNAVTLGGDIIVAINNNRIRTSDDLASFLEEYTLPGQTVSVTVIRDNQSVNISVVLGTRPGPSSSGTSS
jgi:S1-C subfamily serine protease